MTAKKCKLHIKLACILFPSSCRLRIYTFRSRFTTKILKYCWRFHNLKIVTPVKILEKTMRIFSRVHYFYMSTTNMLVWGTKFYAVLKHKYVTFDICFKNKSKLIINSHHGNRFRPYYVGLGTTVRVQHAYE